MKTIDNHYSWIEGLKNGQWFPLYCFRVGDPKIKPIMRAIKAEHARGGKQDSLYEFSRFRIHPAGEYMESNVSISEIRQDIGVENLARILSTFNRTHCGVRRNSTGEICRLPFGHKGKHSPKEKGREK